MASPEGSRLPPFTPTTEFKYTTSPNPGWKYGQNIASTPAGQAWMEGEKEGWTVLDTSKEETRCASHSCRPNWIKCYFIFTETERYILSWCLELFRGLSPLFLPYRRTDSRTSLRLGLKCLYLSYVQDYLLIRMYTAPLKLVQSSEHLNFSCDTFNY